MEIEVGAAVRSQKREWMRKAALTSWLPFIR